MKRHRSLPREARSHRALEEGEDSWYSGGIFDRWTLQSSWLQSVFRACVCVGWEKRKDVTRERRDFIRGRFWTLFTREWTRRPPSLQWPKSMCVEMLEASNKLSFCPLDDLSSSFTWWSRYWEYKKSRIRTRRLPLVLFLYFVFSNWLLVAG